METEFSKAVVRATEGTKRGLGVLGATPTVGSGARQKENAETTDENRVAAFVEKVGKILKKGLAVSRFSVIITLVVGGRKILLNG